MGFEVDFTLSAKKEFNRYKSMGEKTFAQLDEAQLLHTYHPEDNSIAQITKHMVGNMRSRWTNFLTEDGEKTWRHRDTEFEQPYSTKKELLEAWESGWQLVFNSLDSIDPGNFATLIYIRKEPHSIMEAVLRQLAHYASHVGQIVALGKSIKGDTWESLSIPKGQSEAFNRKFFDAQNPL